MESGQFMATGKFLIHHAEPGDLPGILAILNHYIRTHHCTFDTERWSVEEKQEWFDAFTPEGPWRLLTARMDDKLIGYAHSTRWRPKAAYDVTVETTVYVSPDHRSKGVGEALMKRLLADLAETDIHSAVAGIAQPNPASNRLHERLGFREVGTYREVGFKFDRYWDVTWYQKIIDRTG